MLVLASRRLDQSLASPAREIYIWTVENSLPAPALWVAHPIQLGSIPPRMSRSRTSDPNNGRRTRGCFDGLAFASRHARTIKSVRGTRYPPAPTTGADPFTDGSCFGQAPMFERAKLASSSDL